MLGPPRFDVALGDRRTDTPLTLNLVLREQTQESSGAASSSGPVRLTPGPCATLPLGLTEDPFVARIVPTRYNGHVIMYTDSKVMTVQERNALISTSLPDLEAQTVSFQLSFHVPTLTIKTSWYNAVLPLNTEEH